MTRVRKATGLDVPMAQLFSTPTIASLAESMERFNPAGSGASQPIPRAQFSAEERAAGVPCSTNQEQMLVLHQMLRNSATYNMANPMRLDEQPNVEALEIALGILTRRHETLRTHFLEVDGRMLQAVLPPEDPQASPKLQQRSLPADSGMLEVASLISKLESQPYSLLGAGVPLRYVLIRAGSGAHVLYSGMHHILR